MTVCPRQHKRDIIAQTSRLRVLRCHTQRLSQELSPWLLVTSENVSRHQVLLDTLRREVLRTTPWASATMNTIQLRLLKLGARVQECKDRVKISLPSSCPVAPVLRRSLTLLACVRLTVQGR